MRYKIPAGSIVIVHHTGRATKGSFRRKDYEMLAATHELYYDDGDVFFYPKEKDTMPTQWLEYGIEECPYVMDRTHWGFTLPDNPRHCKFMFVPTIAVQDRQSSDSTGFTEADIIRVAQQWRYLEAKEAMVNKYLNQGRVKPVEKPDWLKWGMYDERVDR